MKEYIQFTKSWFKNNENLNKNEHQVLFIYLKMSEATVFHFHGFLRPVCGVLFIYVCIFLVKDEILL